MIQMDLLNMASQVAQWWKICLPMQEMQEMRVWSLGWEDPLEKEIATHSSNPNMPGIPVDRGAWWATVHGIAKDRHDLVTEHTYTNSLQTLNILESECNI